MAKRPEAPTTPAQWTALVDKQYAEVREVVLPMLAKIQRDYGLNIALRMQRTGPGGVFSVLVDLQTKLEISGPTTFAIHVEMQNERFSRYPDAWGHNGIVTFKHHTDWRLYKMTRPRGWDSKWFPELEQSLTNWARVLVEQARRRSAAEQQAPKIEAYLKGLPVSEDLVKRDVTVKLSWDKTRFEDIRVLETRKDTQHESFYLLDSEARLWLSKTVVTQLRAQPVFQA